MFKSWHGWLGTWNANRRAVLSGCIKKGGSYSLEHLLGLGKEKEQIGTIILWLTQLLAFQLGTRSDGDHCIHLKQSPACNGHMVIAIEWEVTLDYRHMKDTFKKIKILDKKTLLSGPTAQKLTTNHSFQCVLHLIASMMRWGFFPFRNEHYKRFLFNLKWKIPPLPGDLSKRNNNKHSIAQRASALTHITRLSVHALTSPHPAPFPQRVLSPDPNLARPKMLFVKINFQIRLESVYLARRRGTKTAREGTASGGGEGSCSPERGFLGRGAGHSSTAAGHSSRAGFAPRFVAATLSTVLSPSPFLWASKGFPYICPQTPWLQPRRAEPLLLPWWGHPNVTAPVICFILTKVFWSSIVATLKRHALLNEWSHAEGRLIDYGNNARPFFPLINQISHTFLED